jgi:hypothetical protein
MTEIVMFVPQRLLQLFVQEAALEPSPRMIVRVENEVRRRTGFDLFHVEHIAISCDHRAIEGNAII